MTSDGSKEARRRELEQWAHAFLNNSGFESLDPIEPVSDDASFRRYFRLRHSSGTLICVDAPPDKEDNPSFVRVQRLLSNGGVRVPELLNYDLDLGFLLLSDLGDDLLLSKLKASSLLDQNRLYETAIDTLGRVAGVNGNSLPKYDEPKLREEMSLFPDWLLAQQLEITPYPEFESVMELMVASALEQPQVLVHRDYHARNLMLQAGDQLAVIDFQDAVQGPVTYDLVSLLKDCYWQLPREMVVDLGAKFQANHAPQIDQQQFLKWFDWMGFQRHLKCAGIFSRLNLRDNKPGYLGDIPLVVNYLVEVASIYSELHDFGRWLEKSVVPLMAELQAK